MNDYANLIPVNVLTGALGSGKTTLLKDVLRAPQLSATAVLVNELGEIGIDHHLVEHATETTLLLENGCLCCAMRDDLKTALKDLHSRRERGEIPHFERVVVETTGIADPVPIAYTLLAEPVLQHHFRLGNVITVVDAVNAAGQLDRFDESRKQVALADRLVISKVDLTNSDAHRALCQRLRTINPVAQILDVGAADLDPVALLVSDIYDRESKTREVSQWLDSARRVTSAPPATGIRADAHSESIEAHSFSFDTALDWTAFGVWMTLLLHRHGERVLRVKGLLNVAGLPGPVLINGVQHLVHPPTHLDTWPAGADRRSQLVLIMSGLERCAIERSLQAFNAIGNPSPIGHSAVDPLPVAAPISGRYASGLAAADHPVASRAEMRELADAEDRRQ